MVRCPACSSFYNTPMRVRQARTSKAKPKAPCEVCTDTRLVPVDVSVRFVNAMNGIRPQAITLNSRKRRT